MAQLKFSLKTNIIKSIFYDIFSNMSRYYYAYGRALPWETVTGTITDNLGNTSTVIVSDEDNPPAISDSYAYELEVRNDIVYMKAINSSDSCIVIRRINWRPGLIYDMYDDYSADRPAYSGATSLDQSNFYVLTSDFNVYKCLYNNNDGISAIQPYGTSTESVLLSDGYIWKFMYTIPLYLRNKFLTTSWMPCTTALSNQFYSNGTISSYAIESKGAKYVKNSWKVKRINIINGGANYNISNVSITFPNPDSAGGTTATAQVTSVNGVGSIVSIAVTNQGSGYTVQPAPLITDPRGSGLVYSVDYEYDNLAYTIIKVTGDGYNTENPYSLKTITIKNRGEFAGTNPPSGTFFTFVAPDLPGGRLPTVSVTFRSKSTNLWEVNTITVTDPGFGYSSPLIFGTNSFAQVLTDGGFDCDLNVSTQKNEAELVPIVDPATGEISSIFIKNGGSGYTYATVDVIGYFVKAITDQFGTTYVSLPLSENPTDPGYFPGFKKASIQLNFGLGDLETKQSNVELLAVDGAIPVIAVENGGLGYASGTTITIIGDGSGCTAIPVIKNGSIVGVSVTNQGTGYTYANIVVDGSGNGAVLRAILSPKGGHGKDAVSELYANTLMMTNRIGSEKAQNIVLTNDYRQISIIKNPKIYNEDVFFKKATGTACALLECSVNTQNTTAYNAFNQYDTLKLSYDTTKTYTLIEKYSSSNKYYLLVQLVDNFIPSAGNSLINNQGNSITITGVTEPEFNKYSGEMLYIDNRIKFVSTDEQTIVTNTLISF